MGILPMIVTAKYAQIDASFMGKMPMPRLENLLSQLQLRLPDPSDALKELTEKEVEPSGALW